jgi:hypothetical protein
MKCQWIIHDNIHFDKKLPNKLSYITKTINEKAGSYEKHIKISSYQNDNLKNYELRTSKNPRFVILNEVKNL